MNVTESAVLCLHAWRSEVLTGRQTAGWQAPSPLVRGVMEDADAFEFVRDIFDYVALPADAFTAALGLHALAQETPESLPPRLRLAMKVGGIASLGLPWGVVPVVKQRFRAHLSDLLVSGSMPKPTDVGVRAPRVLRDMLGERLEDGTAVDLELLGAPVHGLEGVQREVARLVSFAQTPYLSRLTVSLERFVPTFTAWASDSAAERFIDAAAELITACIAHRVTLTISPQSYAEALLMPSLVRVAQNDPRCEGLKLGVEMLAELPESLDLVREVLTTGIPGHDLEVRVTTRSIVPPETIRSIDQGLPVPSLTEQRDIEQQWVRLIALTLQHDRRSAITPIFATEDPTLLAIAQVLWQQYAPGSALIVHMRRGRAPELEHALRATGITVVTGVPYVHPDEFAFALPWMLDTLTHAVREGSALQRIDALFGEQGEAAIARERDRFTHATSADGIDAASHRFQDRSREWEPSERDTLLMYRPPTEAHRFDTGGLTAAVMSLHRDSDARIRVRTDREQRIPVISDTGFACEPDTDATRDHNRAWMRQQLQRAHHTEVGRDAVKAARTGLWALEPVIDTALTAAAAWTKHTHADRATILRRGALAFVSARDRLTQVIASERGLPVHEIDHEIGVTIDSARYLANQAEGLRTVRGATFTPDPLTLVAVDELTAPGELAEMLIAALAAGSGVMLLTHERVARTAAVLIEELAAAGLPGGVVTLVTAPDHEPFEDCVVRVAERPELSRVLAALKSPIAERLRRRVPTVQRDVRVRSHGTIIVTPTADTSAAVTEIVRSAFWAAGGHHRAARALILTGALAKRGPFLDSLADAVHALVHGHTGASTPDAGGGHDPLEITLAPLPVPPDAAALRALTELAPGESWLVEPQRLSDDGTLWLPGVRLGVGPEATFWADSVGVPVIGVVGAHSMNDAIEKQHLIGGGGVAALQSLSAGDIIPWLERTRASALAVNRATTGARVERFPGGVWRDPHSSWQPLAGGPNRLTPLGTWSLRRGTPSGTLHLRGLDPIVRTLIQVAQSSLPYDEFDLVRRAALADELAWRTQFGAVRDVSGLSTEHNVLRYRRVAVHVRMSQGAELGALVRILAAGLLSRAHLTVSVGDLLPEALRRLLDAHHIPVVIEPDDDWLERASVRGSAISGEGEALAERIRLIGGDPVRAAEWLSARSDVSLWARPVTMAGPVELLGFLREQALSIATTRHGMRASISDLEEWIEELAT